MKKALLTSEPMTDDQRRQLTRLGEDAMAKALKTINPDKSGAQRIHARGDEVMKVVLDKVRELSTSDQFADEEVESSYAYPAGYRVKGMTEQTNILRQLISGVGFADEKLTEKPLPDGAEGYFAIPRWQTIAPTYREAVEKVFALLKKQRDGKFYNYREGRLDERYLRETEAQKAAFQKLGDEQKGYDILVVPAQFGLRHRGRSIRRAREVMSWNEFGLGAFAVGIMLFTHPERLVDYENLWIDCAGDEYAPDADGQFDYAPCFYFNVGKVRFHAYWFDDAHGHYGSASGFLPQ